MVYRVQIANRQNRTYEVTVIQKLSNGREFDAETFLCEKNGRIDTHEIWSETMREFRNSPVSAKERDLYPDYFKRLESKLADCIREFIETNNDETNYSGPCMMTICKAAMEG